jgi:3-deoxy-D-manno-octulosonic acid (KDO) 8-phosphate synthase
MKLCGFEVGLDRPLFLIAGPCAIESRQLAIDTAGVAGVRVTPQLFTTTQELDALVQALTALAR